MRTPRLELDAEGLHQVHGFVATAFWKAVRRPPLAAFEIIGALYGLRLVVDLSWHHRLAGIDTIHVRIEHARTMWRTAVLGRIDHRVREVVVLGPDGTRRMRPGASLAYLEGRKRMMA